MTELLFDGDEAAVVARLEAAKTEHEWNKICDDAKSGTGYPEWWYRAVIASGLGDRKARQFGRAPGITVTTYGR